ncbi:hypothetical protein F8M41_005059 [Gigaspora margarita]|uniref:Uncharacterized protein n=1 Tax=Gigaspora margarita TaxID=4874 RepID=A0A8H3X9F8_GIGMA|nr:hypothetical protein F8M41_005059 [Gigaspora margarita]
MNSPSDEFLRQAAKLKKLCPGILELKFNKNGSVIVIRNGSDLVKRPLRNKKNTSNIKEEYKNIDSYLLHHDEYEQIKIRLNETEMKLVETQSELEKLKQEKMQSCTQATDKNSETNSSVLDKILDEMGGENHVITWKNINTRLESIFGCDEILKVPEETQKNKYLEWIISLQNWAFADKYPVELWKEKAENAFGPFEVQPIISLNKSKKRVSFKEPETMKKKVKRTKKISTTKGKKLLTANNNLTHNDDYDPVDNDEDLTDDDDNQSDIEAALGWKAVAKLILNSKPNIKHPDNLEYDSLQFMFGMKQKEYAHIDFGNELGSVKEGLITWSSIDKNIERVYAEVKLQRFFHFLKLYDAYVVLFQLAIKEPPGSNQKMSIKQKKESGIPLGITAQFRSIRGWVGFRMKSFLQIKSRGERRFWTAICRIRFILNESLATVKQLVNSGASPHFFQMLSDEDFDNFLILIANGKPVNFNLPNKINDILDRQIENEL